MSRALLPLMQKRGSIVMDRFLVKYSYHGKEWGIIIIARDIEDARQAMDYYDVLHIEPIDQ